MVARSHVETQARLPHTKKITASPFDPLVQSIFPKIAEKTPSFITPNAVTVSGMIATALVGLSMVLSRYLPELLFVAAALMLFNWFTDTLDGVLARQRGQCTRLGDFLDHVFDALTVAVVIIGTAFSGLGHPEPILLLGILFLLSFAITYKGEHVTGVYELLSLGPTEVRFVLAGVYVTSYFLRAPLVTVSGLELTVLDLTAIGGCLWAVVYAVVLLRRYGRWVVETER